MSRRSVVGVYLEFGKFVLICAPSIGAARTHVASREAHEHAQAGDITSLAQNLVLRFSQCMRDFGRGQRLLGACTLALFGLT